jgi:hypothetical protein
MILLSQRREEKMNYGQNNRVIARWCNALYETIDKPTKIGVAAYHFSGISRVDFIFNGITSQVSKRTEHDGIKAYWFDLQEIPDAESNELVAIVYPKHGQPFELKGDPNEYPVIEEAPTTPPEARTASHKWGPWEEEGKSSYMFASNFNGTLRTPVFYVSVDGNDANPGTKAAPKASVFGCIRAARDAQGNIDGTTIYLGEGDHLLGTYSYIGNVKNQFRPIVITKDPEIENTPRVIGTNSTGLRINKVKIKDCLVQTAEPNLSNKYAPIISTGNPVVSAAGDTFITFENCHLDQHDMNLKGMDWTNGYKIVNMVNCHVTNCYNGLKVCHLARNCIVRHVHSDMMRGGICALNIKYQNHKVPEGSDAHPDTIQWYRNPSNTVVHRYSPLNPDDLIDAQGVFSNPEAAWGIVNVAIEEMFFRGVNGIFRALNLTQAHNVLIRNSNIGGRWADGFAVIGSLDTGHNCLLQNVTCNTIFGDNEKPVMFQHREAYEAAGRPTDVFEPDQFGGPFYFTTASNDSNARYNAEGGAKGVRYEWNWKEDEFDPTVLSQVLGNWGTAGPDGDLNNDGIVDGQDMTIALNK